MRTGESRTYYIRFLNLPPQSCLLPTSLPILQAEDLCFRLVKLLSDEDTEPGNWLSG